MSATITNNEWILFISGHEAAEITNEWEFNGDGWSSKPNGGARKSSKLVEDGARKLTTKLWTKSHQSLLRDLRQETPDLRPEIFPGFIHQPLFQDTTRLRLMSRPSIKDALHTFSSGTKLGRLGISQSFRERLAPSPNRARDAPPPPPPQPGLPGASRSLTKKFFSFNKAEIRKINKFLGIRSKEADEDTIYDIAEDEVVPPTEVKVIDNSRFYADSPRIDSSIYEDTPLKLKTGSDAHVKSVRPKRERSKSFNPRSKPLHKGLIFNRSLSQISTSSSSSVQRSESCRKLTVTGPEEAPAKRTLSSSDLIHIFPDEERRSFKDIRKILSSPSISSNGSTSSGIYRPKSQLSNSSSVINSIKEEQVEIVPAKDYFEHIYEEINDRDLSDGSKPRSRPLPPLPAEKQGSSVRSSPTRSSPVLSEQSSPVKSIFEGASKYDILNYLEDARERGLTDCDLDLEEEEEEEAGVEPTELNLGLNLGARGSSNLCSSSSSSEEQLAAAKEKQGSVDIERNDSGRGKLSNRKPFFTTF